MSRQVSLTASAALIVCALSLLPACSGSGGGGGTTAPSGPQIPAAVPEGAGLVSIDMTGTWELQDPVIIDTNDPTPTLPLVGTAYVIEPGRIASILGVPVSPVSLEAALMSPLLIYVNQVDDRRLFYAFAVDRRAGGASRLEVAVAGGALDADTIAVEQYQGEQFPGEAEASYTRSRFVLRRVSTSPAWVDPEGPDAAATLERAFGVR